MKKEKIDIKALSLSILSFIVIVCLIIALALAPEPEYISDPSINDIEPDESWYNPTPNTEPYTTTIDPAFLIGPLIPATIIVPIKLYKAKKQNKRK